MLQQRQVITLTDFNKGLYTGLDFLNNEKEQSPNSMNIKWDFDGVLQKRLGSSTTNTVAIGSTTLAGWTLETGTQLTTGLRAYWKLDETSGSRSDQVGTLTLNAMSSPGSIVGIRGNAALFTGDSQGLYVTHNSSVSAGTGNFTISLWIYANSGNGTQVIASKREEPSIESNDTSWQIFKDSADIIRLQVSSNGSTLQQVVATSNGAISLNSWHNIVFWIVTNNHVGISVDLSATTASFGSTLWASTGNFKLANSDTASGLWFSGRIDEVGVWSKFVTATERAEIYGNGTANTYTGTGQTGFSWAMYDFGASAIRWLTVAAGTGIYASSNRGTTFLTVGTTRTQNYQYFERSRNSLIATSDSYDPTLYWAGSVGTFFLSLAPNSAPRAKYSINHQGFLILLNTQDSNGTTRTRGFYYADDASQNTSTWSDNFDLPSSADDQITAAFKLGKTLYVSTRYKIFRVSYVGGNPDWSYQEYKDWGYVPRTVKKITMKGGEVVVGMDWQRRLRVFDGTEDLIISENVEADNGLCDFALDKVSFAGSGLALAHAVVDQLEQEYRLCLAIGPQSTQTTHSLLLNGRTLAMFPYSNQQFQCMCMAESNNQLALMAADRSGYIHILNSGNRDVATAIDEVYESPFIFRTIPQAVNKSDKLDLYFVRDSAGTLYYQDRVDFRSPWSDKAKSINITESGSNLHIMHSEDISSIHNIYQFKLASSASTADPWRLTRVDYLFKQAGIGKTTP